MQKKTQKANSAQSLTGTTPFSYNPVLLLRVNKGFLPSLTHFRNHSSHDVTHIQSLGSLKSYKNHLCSFLAKKQNQMQRWKQAIKTIGAEHAAADQGTNPRCLCPHPGAREIVLRAWHCVTPSHFCKLLVSIEQKLMCSQTCLLWGSVSKKCRFSICSFKAICSGKAVCFAINLGH